MRGLLHHPYFHKGQKGIDAISPASRPTILHDKRDALLIVTSATKLISVAVQPRLGLPDRRYSAFLSIGPRRDGAQRHRFRGLDFAPRGRAKAGSVDTMSAVTGKV
jgi:hypothetical protein